MADLIRNSKKPLAGLIAGAIAWLALKAGLSLDPDLAAALSGGIAAAVVRAVKPIFGFDVKTPEIETGPHGGRKLKSQR